jgi:hypothetical protein
MRFRRSVGYITECKHACPFYRGASSASHVKTNPAFAPEPLQPED